MVQFDDHGYQAIAVVSPMFDGPDVKDQDRAVWFDSSQTACVCDGATSSPFGELAADFVTIWSRALFSGDWTERLRFLSDILIAARTEKLTCDIRVPADMPSEMKAILQDAAREKIKSSFQTTLVAARFIPQGGIVLASVVRCGDSMFAAFDDNGHLLTCSPPDPSPQDRSTPWTDSPSVRPRRCITFGPGDELLAKVQGTLIKFPHVADRLQIRFENRSNWLLCYVVDKSTAGRVKNSPEKCVSHFRYGDPVIVPRYLVGKPIPIGGTHYINLPYSRAIQWVNNTHQAPSFQQKGNVTAVLPDHFYTGNWIHFQDRFPLDSQFVLCSDGFYGCFDQPTEIWAWLNDHRKVIDDPQQRNTLLRCLHDTLRQKISDDDISFVWVRPAHLFRESADIKDGTGKEG
jgi:serine/threonine protein phosphatase PrpC